MAGQSAKIVVYLLLLCLLQIGISLIWMDPNHINGDTFYYVSIANYYLYAPVVHIRDAFTVGPIIPAVIAATKFVALKFVRWSPDVDIAVLKALSFSCYVVMVLSAYRLVVHHVDRKKTTIVLFFLFGLLGCVTDTLSLNGELVAVATLSVLMVVLLQQQRSPLRYLAIAILSTIVIYTKIQAGPLLFLLLASESNSRKELATIMLYTGSVTLCAEAFLYLNGVGLVKSFMYMYVYLSKGGVVESVSIDAHLSLYSRCLKYLEDLDWQLKKAIVDFSFIFILVGLLLFGKVGPRKNLLSDWKVWLGVSVFTVVAPGRHFEHYLMFMLPFTFRFAGPAVAGVHSAPLSPNAWRYFQEGMAVFLLVELAAAVPNLNPYSWKWASAFPAFVIGKGAAGMQAIITHNPGTAFVNGWDYRMYSYTNTYSTWGELPLVWLGVLDEREYVNNLIKNRFDYLIDVIDYSGSIRIKKYALSSQGIEAAVVARYYDLAYEKDKLRLYRRKTGQHPPYVALGIPQRITLSLVSSTLGCKDCFPDYPGISSLPGEDKFGTYTRKKGQPTTGEFVVSYVPQGTINQIKYAVGLSPESLGIDIYNDCVDGRRIKRSVDMERARFDVENDAYFDNDVCSTRLVELHFTDAGTGLGQWLGLLGVDGY